MRDERFEVHVTATGCSESEFVSACQSMGCKPVIMQSLNHDVLEFGPSSVDMITVSHAADEMLAFAEIDRVVGELSSRGIETSRHKLETSGLNLECIYHEAHLSYGVLSKAQIRSLIGLGLGISVDVGPIAKVVATVRSHRSLTHLREMVRTHVNAAKESIKIKPYKIVFESCSYDTDPRHDDDWLVAET